MFVNQNGQRIGISDIPISWLCPHCWEIISDFCRAAKVVDKVSIDLAGDEVLCEIMRHSRRTKNPILHALYRDLKFGLRSVLNEPGKESRVFTLLKQLTEEQPSTYGHA